VKRPPIVKHPDLHLFATHVARRLGCARVVDLGCAQPGELAKVHPKAEVIGLGIDVDLRAARSEYRFARWMNWKPGSAVLEKVTPDMAVESVVVTVIDTQRPATRRVVEGLKELMEYAPAAVVAATGTTVAGLRSLLESAGFRVDFVGLTASDNLEFRKETPLAILSNNHGPTLGKAPQGYRVVAIMAMYNEEDIVVPSIEALIDQGVEVYLLDNWSTDRTAQRAEQFLDRGVIAIEKFPSDGPSDTFPYIAILGRKAELSRKLEGDWFLHMDVDEVRRSPWPGTSLKDALYYVDRQGFNAVDHTVLKFLPIDNDYEDGTSFERYFDFFRFVFQQDFQIKMWKNDGKPVALGHGHRASFAGRRVYPYNFIYNHYPVRSQQHGERKIFSERKPRMDAEELAAGWHRHYDRIVPEQNFVEDPAELTRFDDAYYEEFLVERLAGIGPEERAAWAARRRERPPLRRLAGRIRRRLGRLRRRA
jgi:glycosyltransferase involved in cell wall biosynthesis